ncbi:MAG TPA: S41 family peptidase [Thermoanaerobacterales bacterium]|nr:S41 family peptidase [Thermoanaerobacterales bacterium]
MKRYYKKLNPYLIAMLIGLLLLTPCTYCQAENSNNKIPADVNFLMQLKEFLKNNYVDEVSDIDLLRGAIDGMVDSLGDPYSQYFTPKDFQDFNETTSGNFGGIGVVINTKDKQVIVVSVLEGTPADRAGIKAGDKIIEVDGKETSELSLNEVSALIKGEAGTVVNMGILRDGEKQILKLDLPRETIKINPIEHKILGQGIGYLKIGEFNENTVANLDRALEDFRKGGVLGIVLDLRNNPGGLLDQAVGVSARFVPKGPVVKVVAKDGKDQTFMSNTEPSPFKLVVLVNGGSASAAEIVAGAIKDRGTGIIVGEKTFGKATVQRPLNLGILGGIKLTIARYVTPNGTDINKEGIHPDVVVEYNKAASVNEFAPIKQDKVLKYGNIGIDVLGLQQRLNFIKLLNASPDGVYGPRTKDAVKALQRRKGLAVTGIADKSLYNALDEAVAEYINSQEDVQLRRAIDLLKEELRKGAA